MSEDENEVPQNLKEITCITKALILPPKSKQQYEEAYNTYKKWCFKNMKSRETTENNILVYFNSGLINYKSSSLWSKYSMLRATISLRERVDISQFSNLLAYLKGKSRGYKPKRSSTLSKENILTFLNTADNEIHLLNKVVLIFGIAGGCKRHELTSLLIDNVEDCQNHFLVKLIDESTKLDRSFVILPGLFNHTNLLEVIRQYTALRPEKTKHNRFFVNYCKWKCTVQPVGIHKIAAVPSVVAKYLNLENPNEFTGHCFRRSSAFLLSNAGATRDEIKRYGGWISSSFSDGPKLRKQCEEPTEEKVVVTDYSIQSADYLDQNDIQIKEEFLEDETEISVHSLAQQSKVGCRIFAETIKPSQDAVDSVIACISESSHHDVAGISPEDDYYNMCHPRRGKALIFNHYKYDDTRLNPREGTHVDVKNLQQTLELLNYEVITFEDLKYGKIYDIITETAEEDHSDADSLAVFVMTHGEEGILHARDNCYPAEFLWRSFSSDKCPTLSGKPKLFFIQACRGDKLDSGTRIEYDSHHTKSYVMPTMADILVMYSTTADYYSFRSPIKGSWFIQALCLELAGRALRQDLLTILTFVNRKIAIGFQSNVPTNKEFHEKKQVGSIMSSLTRLLHFFERS